MGPVFLVIGYKEMIPGSRTNRNYVCGSAPTYDQIESRGVPVCLQTNVEYKYSLCLRSQKNITDPPEWCSRYSSSSHKPLASPFRFWWNNGAWRISTNDKEGGYNLLGEYKLPTSDQPGPGDMPPDSSDEWSFTCFYIFGCSAKPSTITFTFDECPSLGENAELQIPGSCYVEIEARTAANLAIGVIGLIITSCLVIIVLSPVAVAVVACEGS